MNPVEFLGKIIEISQSNVEPSSRIRSILNIVAQDMGYEDTVLFTFDNEKRLQCRFKNDQSALFPLLAQYRCFVGEGIIGSVAQKRVPQFYSISTIPPRFGCLFYPQLNGIIDRYKSFAFIPVCDDSHIYGVFFASSQKRGAVSNPDKTLLAMVTREIAGILNFMNLMLSSKKRISELATLNDLGQVLTASTEPTGLLKNIALIVGRALNADFVSILLERAIFKLETGRIIYGKIGTAIDKHIADIEQAVVKKALQTPNRLEIHEIFIPSTKLMLYSVPMVSQERLMGIVTLAVKKNHKEPYLDEENKHLLRTIANYLSSGLENTLLNTRLREVIKELNEAQKRIIEQEKLRSLGEMTANIAHEIKNPLVIIGGFTKRLAKKVKLDKTETKYVDMILEEVTRLESILNDVLDYARDNPAMVGTCNVNECLDELIYLFASDVSWENIQIERSFEGGIEPILCDVQQFKQVFINLFMNAYDAMRGKGKILIKTARVVINEIEYVAISLTDTGGGIDPSIIENIFNPFFTTKERGTGLGLAISNKIVLSHNGHIEVVNTLGKGATFTVYLPQKATNNLAGERSVYEIDKIINSR